MSETHEPSQEAIHAATNALFDKIIDLIDGQPTLSAYQALTNHLAMLIVMEGRDTPEAMIENLANDVRRIIARNTGKPN